jgi:hypothetical protein
VAILLVEDRLKPIALYEGKTQALEIFTRLRDRSLMSADDQCAEV